VTEPVETLYTSVDGFQVAYQQHGSGSVDMLFIDGWIGCSELDWDDPAYARLLRRYGRFTRMIRFDRRGSGMSDPVQPGTAPGVNAWVRDAIGVLDALGIARCSVQGSGLGGPMAIRLAAQHPDRVDALVLTNTFARLRAAPDHPFGLSDETIAAAMDAIGAGWGHGVMVDIYGVEHDEQARVQMARYERLTASPTTAATLTGSLIDIDVRGDLHRITAPTLVVHRSNLILDIQHGRSLAAAIPGATFVEDTTEWIWRTDWDEDPPGLAHIAEFLTGVRHDTDPNRVFATLLFTDIVGSTELAATIGDRRWRTLLNAHDAETHRQVQRSGGRVVQHTGDGVLAVFPTPTPAIDCAVSLRDALAEHNIAIRIGLHAAEIAQRADNVGGIGVHIAARVNALAESGEILVTNTVRDLVAGSGFTFADRGTHTLKGVPETWNLSALDAELRP
jgi:class 3 adenylate cyclase